MAYIQSFGDDTYRKNEGNLCYHKKRVRPGFSRVPRTAEVDRFVAPC